MDARVADPSERVPLVEEAIQLYEDARVRGDPLPIVARFVAPLTRLYVEHHAELDRRTRVRLIELLAQFADPRAAPAFEKALQEFVKKPRTEATDSDIKWAVRAVGALRLQTAAPALEAACMKLRASTPLGLITYRDCNEAMLAMPQQAWVAPLTAALETKMVRPKNARDRSGIDAYRDELYRQTNAAQVLGELRAAGAVEPLLRVMLDPSKADVHATAILALVKIGKPAVARGIELLKDPQHTSVAAIVLGTIGRPEAEAPMVAALKSTTSPVDRAVLARELTKLPPSTSSKAAFRSAFEALPPATTVPPGLNGLEMLSESAAQFYDPSLIDWLLERAAKAQGPKERADGLRSTILVVVLKLAKPDQLPRVRAAVDRWGGPVERELYAQTEGIVARCKTDASCYARELENPQNQGQKRQFSGIKAGYMAAIFGNAATREEIVAALPSVDNAALRFIAAQAIDHLSPKGARETAARIRKQLEQNTKSRDHSRIAGDAALKQVVYRIETRAD